MSSYAISRPGAPRVAKYDVSRQKGYRHKGITMEAIDERIGEFVTIAAGHQTTGFGVYQGLTDDGQAIVTDPDGDVWYIQLDLIRFQ